MINFRDAEGAIPQREWRKHRKWQDDQNKELIIPDGRLTYSMAIRR